MEAGRAEGSICLQVGLTLPTEGTESCTSSSKYIGTPVYSRLESVEKILEKKGTFRSATMIPFIDRRNKVDDYSILEENRGERNRDLERMGSRTRILFQLCDSSSRQDIRNFERSGHGKLLPSQFEGVVPHPNGRWEAQVYQNHRPPVGLRTFNQEEELGSSNVQRQEAIGNFKPAEESHLETLFLSEHSAGELVKNAHAVSVIDGVPRDGNEDKGGGEASEKSESPSGKEKSSREHMFDKAVTPSDVGKLNRLVIPKQHAEKYFPLHTNANKKELLLNFEDNTGKIWKFRYSYWNSSQSYVLTKGWTRFVKEKRLDAGDIVSFERGRDEQNVERLFISWRRRPCALQPSKAARGLSLPSLATSPSFQYGSFPSRSLNIRAGGGKLGQGRHLNAFPEWLSVVWTANNGGASSRPAPMWAEQIDTRQPQPMTMDMRLIHAEEGQNSAREPLDFMQLKASPGERAWPVQNAAIKSSKKGVRLFGVNL